LENLLPKLSKFKSVKHHAALPYEDLPQFMQNLAEREGTASRALEFAILSSSRTGEVLGASWDEFDLDQKTWTIPAERMKAGKEHRVPLSVSALAILEKQKKLNSSNIVFCGPLGGRLSDMALLMMLRRMKRQNITSHGFRSTFSTWAADRTSFPREIVERSLAHIVGNKVENAYQRSDQFEKRRELMDRWAQFCTQDPRANVVPLRA